MYCCIVSDINAKPLRGIGWHMEKVNRKTLLNKNQVPLWLLSCYFMKTVYMK